MGDSSPTSYDEQGRAYRHPPRFPGAPPGAPVGLGGMVAGGAPVRAPGLDAEPPPPPPPDLTDETVQKARAAMRKRAMMGGALASSFLTGPLGDMSAVSTSASGLVGY